AIVLRPLLEPLDEAGPFGEFGTGMLADQLARRDASGFATALAAQLERR
ncbi:MAG: hypothetical protein JO192_04970, partial [Candidatus Eremiobacteraeota bacterium]|nr:hypothetical protein [Candidatus Eremiobacteraeota bacterium]